MKVSLSSILLCLVVTFLFFVPLPIAYGLDGEEGYDNELIIRSDRLEQDEQIKTSQASRLAGLFNEKEHQRLKVIQEAKIQARREVLASLFTRETASVETLDKATLFSEHHYHVAYSQSHQSEQGRDFSMFFYGLFLVLVFGVLVVISYLFLKG